MCFNVEKDQKLIVKTGLLSESKEFSKFICLKYTNKVV